LIDESGKKFGIKVDKIESIVHVDESNIKTDAHLQKKSRYLDISGVLEHENQLSSIVSQIRL